MNNLDRIVLFAPLIFCPNRAIATGTEYYSLLRIIINSLLRIIETRCKIQTLILR